MTSVLGVTRRSFLRGLAAVCALAAAGLAPFGADAADKGPVVFAAASLKNALDGVNAAWQTQSGKQATISYAASSALAKQIEQGAPAEVFISADEDWMDYLAARKLIKPATRFNLLANTLVLIAPKDSALKPTTIAPAMPLASLLGDGRLAVANVEAVPAGKYAKAGLTKLGLWEAVKDKTAQAENVRAALALVSRGETPLGIVYGTDAHSDPKVKVIATFPEGTNPPILYPAAETTAAGSDAAAFLGFLKSSRARAIFEAEGFVFQASSS
jgi:molybdate transport system substrate-binding protein